MPSPCPSSRSRMFPTSAESLRDRTRAGPSSVASGGGGAAAPTFATLRLASSLPQKLRQRLDHQVVGLLAADRHAQAMRQVIGGDAAQDEAALGEERVGLLGGAALRGRKVDQHEIS